MTEKELQKRLNAIEKRMDITDDITRKVIEYSKKNNESIELLKESVKLLNQLIKMNYDDKSANTD